MALTLVIGLTCCRSFRRRMMKSGSRIFGGRETCDYFLTDVLVRGCQGRPWRLFAKVQAIRKEMRMAATAPCVDGIESEIASRFVSLWEATRDKFWQRFAERIKRQPHSARS